MSLRAQEKLSHREGGSWVSPGAAQETQRTPGAPAPPEPAHLGWV